MANQTEHRNPVEVLGATASTNGGGFRETDLSRASASGREAGERTPPRSITDLAVNRTRQSRSRPRFCGHPGLPYL